MKICVAGGEPELGQYCRVALQELAAEDWELIASPIQPELPEADFYIWDFQPESFPSGLSSEKIRHSLFVLEPKLLQRFRELLGPQRAAILLKPVQPAALHPFLEHSIGQCRPAARKPDGAEHAEVDDLLDCLLHANYQLQECDRARTNFLTRAARDLQGPLTALSGYCGLMIAQKLGPLNSEQADLLCRMQHSLKRVSRLAEAMFELSAGPRTQRGSDRHPADVEACIGEAVQDITPQAEEKQIHVTVSVENPGKPLIFDSARIGQVLVNLLENACRFTPKRGVIEVSGYPVSSNSYSTRIPPGSVPNGEPAPPVQISNAYRIDVRDSGTGIPNEHIEYIFEESASYSSGRDRSSGGLGLAICRMIVEQHGGKIWAESCAAGTQFSFVIPHSAGALARTPDADAATPLRAKALSA